jgi:hypothetical protein
MIYFDAVILDIILAFCIASYGKSKGMSFAFWFIVSVVLDPAVGLIMMLVAYGLTKIAQSLSAPEKAERSIVDVTPRSMSKYHGGSVTPEELYRQSDALYQQAAKRREAADQLSQKYNQKSVRKLGFRHGS